MRDLIADSVADRRFILLLLSITGFLALAMSAAGIYGVISYITSRCTQEIGIRMALGATPNNVFTLIFRQGSLPIALGLAIGLTSALLGGRLLHNVLIGIEPGHPGPIGVAAGGVAVTAAIACWIPALRAARMNPMSALRQD
jgi:putative ABC transport system permease protein